MLRFTTIAMATLLGCHEGVLTDAPIAHSSSEPPPTTVRWSEVYDTYFHPKCAHCHKEFDTPASGYKIMFGKINLLQPHEPGYPPYDPPIFWDPLLIRTATGKIDPQSPLINPKKTYLFIMSEPGGGFSGDEPNMPFDEYKLAPKFPDASLANDSMKALILRWVNEGALE